MRVTFRRAADRSADFAKSPSVQGFARVKDNTAGLIKFGWNWRLSEEILAVLRGVETRGRHETARRLRDLVETIGNDLGGIDHLSEGQKQLIRRAATLSIKAEAMEADAVRNLAFDGEAYGVLCDRLGRCLQRLIGGWSRQFNLAALPFRQEGP